MSMSKRLLLGALALLVLLGVGIMLTATLIIFPQVQAIERDNRVSDLNRVVSSVKRDGENLRILASDWAKWDDTYDYSKGDNSDYEESNLTESLLDGLEVDALGMIRADGSLLWQQFSSSVSDSVSTDDLHSEIINLLLDTPDISGLLYTQSMVWLVSSSLILKSDGTGPQQGLLYFAKQINPSYIEKLSLLIELPVELKVSSDSVLQPSVTFVSDQQSHASVSMNLINDSKNRLNVILNQQRPFHEQMLETIVYTLTVVFLIGTFAVLLGYVTIRKNLVLPLLELQHQTELFGKDANSGIFKSYNSNDELGQLTRAVMQMAKKLEVNMDLLKNERERFMDASYTDDLTMLKNRRYMDRFLANELTQKTGEDWLFLMFDCDFFKNVNDTFGHDMGDKVLIQFASLLKKYSRDDDIVVRYGGEEFVIICPEANESLGCSMSERIRSKVEEFSFGDVNQPLNLTCSIGFFTTRSVCTEGSSSSWAGMIKLADMALFAAKYSGRNAWVGLKCNYPKIWSEGPVNVDQLLQHMAQEHLTLFSSLDSVMWGENKYVGADQ
jgi:diguanylate cyclase (GGDEF)-like protein